MSANVEDYWKIGSFAKEIENATGDKRHANTLDNWFKGLEDKNIHFVPRAGKEKVYSEVEKEIALFFNTKRKEGWAIDVIQDEVKTRFSDKLNKYNPNTGEEVQSIEELKEQMLEWMQQTTSQVADEKVKALEEKFKSYKNDNEKKRYQDRHDAINLELKKTMIRKELKKEAIELWEKEPDEKKFIEVEEKGIFGLKKVRTMKNIEGRNDFIEEYIDEHMFNRLKKETGYEEIAEKLKTLNAPETDYELIDSDEQYKKTRP